MSAASVANHQPDDVLAKWTSQYPLPSEDGGKAALPEKKALYAPPRSDFIGCAIACSIIATWAVLLWHALFRVKLPGYAPEGTQPASWLHVVGLFLALEFIYTGLFITTHDAMHGTIAYRNRKLNDMLGWIAISAYAWFDYDMLHRNHWLHHNHTGVPHQDPDFHRGNPNVLLWFAQFMWEYSTLGQFFRIGCWANALMLFGAPYENVLVFMTAAPILSAFRLFYFGTFIPHHPPKGYTGSMPWHVARTSPASRLQSFFTCYHFDLHWEHHRWPYAPWWQLPTCRQLAGRTNAGPAPLPTATAAAAAAAPAGAHEHAQ